MVDIDSLVGYTDSLLEPGRVSDWTPNGLQVAGRERVGRLVTGVTACQGLLDAAVEWGADLVLVHHGWFWKGEPAVLTGMRYRRVRTVVEAGFGLLAYHLPLDIHPQFGNNAQLAHRFGLTVEGRMTAAGIPDLLWHGRLTEPLSSAALAERIATALGREPLQVGPRADHIERVAWCSGAAHDLLDSAAALGVDAFISGEAAERTTHAAREQGVHFFAAGHHATERYGVQALGAHLAARYDLEHRFVDIDNPV